MLFVTVLASCQEIVSRDHLPQRPVESLRLLKDAQSVFLRDSADGASSRVVISDQDGLVIEGKDYFNSSEPWSIREVRPGHEAIAVGYSNCYHADEGHWTCGTGGMQLGLPDFSDALILGSSQRDALCGDKLPCKVIGMCVAGSPELGETPEQPRFSFIVRNEKVTCYIVRLEIPSLRVISVEESAYIEGKPSRRASYSYDLDERISPFKLPVGQSGR